MRNPRCVSRTTPSGSGVGGFSVDCVLSGADRHARSAETEARGTVRRGIPPGERKVDFDSCARSGHNDWSDCRDQEAAGP